MKARRKIPDGQWDTSSRSSASSNATLIFVCSAMEASEICCRSRCWRNRAPKLSAMQDLGGHETHRYQHHDDSREEKHVVWLITRERDQRAASGEASPRVQGRRTLRIR